MRANLKNLRTPSYSSPLNIGVATFLFIMRLKVKRLAFVIFVHYDFQWTNKGDISPVVCWIVPLVGD